MPTSCPYSDDDLVPLSAGEPGSTELQAHVAACPRCQSALVRLASQHATLQQAALHLTATGPSVRPSGAPSGTLGKYVIIGKLSEVADAVIYRAIHSGHDFQVFIRLEKKPVAEKTERNRLMQQARSLVEVVHPNLLRVRDLGFQEDCPFLVTDFLKGKSLDALHRENRLPPQQAAGLLAQVAGALGVLHRRGAAHGAVSASKIIVDPNGQAHLGFFGLEADKTPQDDLAAVGEVLFFLLTDKPYTGDWTPLETGIPTRVQAICRKALTGGYASAESLANDLDRFSRAAMGRWPWVVAGLLALALLFWLASKVF